MRPVHCPPHRACRLPPRLTPAPRHAGARVRCRKGGAAKRGTGVKYEDVAGIDHIKQDIQVGGWARGCRQRCGGACRAQRRWRAILSSHRHSNLLLVSAFGRHAFLLLLLTRCLAMPCACALPCALQEILNILLGDEEYEAMGAHPMRVRVPALCCGMRCRPAATLSEASWGCGSDRAAEGQPCACQCCCPGWAGHPRACIALLLHHGRLLTVPPSSLPPPPPAGRAAGGPSRHRQDAAGQGDGWGGGHTLLLG